MRDFYRALGFQSRWSLERIGFPREQAGADGIVVQLSALFLILFIEADRICSTSWTPPHAWRSEKKPEDMTIYPFSKRLSWTLKAPSKRKGGMPVAINTVFEFRLTFSRPPATISNVHANLDLLLDKMTKGSILPVTTFSPHIL